MDKPWKVITAFIGVFVAGAVFGGFFTLGFGWKVMDRHAPASGATPPAPPTSTVVTAPPTNAPSAPLTSSAPIASTSPVGPATNPASVPKKPGTPTTGPVAAATPGAQELAQLRKRLTERLGLTPAQRDRIMPLLQRASEDFARQRENWFREDHYILQRLQQDISKELTPEQRTKLEDIARKQNEYMRKQRAEREALQKANAAPTAPATSATSSVVVTPAEGMSAPVTPASSGAVTSNATSAVGVGTATTSAAGAPSTTSSTTSP